MIEFASGISAPQVSRDSNLNAVVLIGGESRRMGRPKQTLRRGGVTLAEIAVAAVEGFVHRVVLAGDGPVPENLGSLECIADIPGLAGPLGGILAAMRKTPESAWIVSACDMPCVRREAIGWLLSQRRPGVWAILPRSAAGRVEPLLALYEPQMKNTLERRAAMGRFGFQRLAGSKRVMCPSPPDEIRDAWTGVNTLEEFEGASVIDV
jgi:molybdopterin-guanine dinucleotide biosynthesis protein A